MLKAHLFSFALLFPASGAALFARPVAVESSHKAVSIQFNGKPYLLRWSQGGQYEFTPAGQEDLNAWTDMVTIWIYPTITDGDGLALQANRVLETYERAHGKVLRTNSVPRILEKPAEHFLAAMLGSPQFLEFVADRFLLAGGKGVGVVYSHRAYGEHAAPELGSWVAQNGPVIEKIVMAFDASQTVSILGK